MHSIQKNSTPDIYILNTTPYRNWLPCRTNTLQTLWSRFIFYLFYCYKIRLHKRKVRCPVELYLEFLITIYNVQWVRSLRIPSNPFPFFIRLDIIVSRRKAHWTPVLRFNRQPHIQCNLILNLEQLLIRYLWLYIRKLVSKCELRISI